MTASILIKLLFLVQSLLSGCNSYIMIQEQIFDKPSLFLVNSPSMHVDDVHLSFMWLNDLDRKMMKTGTRFYRLGQYFFHPP